MKATMTQLGKMILDRMDDVGFGDHTEDDKELG